MDSQIHDGWQKIPTRRLFCVTNPGGEYQPADVLAVGKYDACSLSDASYSSIFQCWPSMQKWLESIL